jgi:hypothetical protein
MLWLANTVLGWIPSTALFLPFQDPRPWQCVVLAPRGALETEFEARVTLATHSQKIYKNKIKLFTYFTTGPKLYGEMSLILYTK